MRNVVLAFGAGIAIAALVVSAVFLFVIRPQYADEKFELGRQHGIVQAQSEILREVKRHLGDDVRSSDGYQPLFTVKAGAVVIVHRNGVKTLRTLPY